MKELEDASMDLLNAYEKCRNLSVAIQFVGDHYQPREGVLFTAYSFLCTFLLLLLLLFFSLLFYFFVQTHPELLVGLIFEI